MGPVRDPYPPPPMHEADLRLLRLMRTRGHSPGLESAAKALGKAGNNGAVWVVLGVVFAVLDWERREAWLICAALGPVAIALNYGIKLLVKRPRPVLEGLPPLGGAPSSLSFPSAHSTLLLRRRDRDDPGRPGAPRSPSSSPCAIRSAAPTWGCTTRPTSPSAPCSAALLGPDRAALDMSGGTR